MVFLSDGREGVMNDKLNIGDVLRNETCHIVLKITRINGQYYSCLIGERLDGYLFYPEFTIVSFGGEFRYVRHTCLHYDDLALFVDNGLLSKRLQESIKIYKDLEFAK